MSRSTRRPFAAMTGTCSAKDDRRLAHRGVRRNQNLALKICADCEDFLVRRLLECAWNNNYCCGRDGAQGDCSSLRYSSDDWSQKRYRKLLRK